MPVSSERISPMNHQLVPLLIAALLTACQSVPLPQAGMTGPSQVTFMAGQPVIQGQVHMPGFTAKATSDQVANEAFVALIDANGITQAGGVTDATGGFTLFPVANGFTHVDGAFYTLEVRKRPAIGPTLTLRTTARLQYGGWTSITGPTVVINLTTTAVAMIDADDVAVTPADTMGKVTGASYDQVTAIRTWSPQRIASRVASLTAVLADGGDPGDGQAVIYTGDYVIKSPETLANFKHYTAITGHLVMPGPQFAAVDLPRLRTIGGHLWTVGTAHLTTMNLPSLQTVGGELTLEACSNLDTVNLPSLQTVGSNLKINACFPLKDLSGLAGLTTVGGNLTITSCTGLKSLGLAALATVKGDVTIQHNLQLPPAEVEALRVQVSQ